MSRYVSFLVRLCLIWTLLGGLVAPAWASEISDWLMKVETAPERVSYIGSFLYEHDGKMETMRVVHRVQDKSFRERLYSLTGSAREIIRDDKSVWCYIPDKQIGVHENRQSSRNAFLQLRGEQISGLDNYYSFKLGSIGRVADRPAQRISIMPRDGYRYGYELWVDEETGLLLRSDLKNESGQTIERYMFVEISIGGNIADAELEPMTPGDSLSWFGIDKSGQTEAVAPDKPMAWDSKALPGGFMLSYSINRRSPMDDDVVEHHVYSDGLSSVSLFVKKATDSEAKAEGVTRMGAVSAYSTRIDDFDITVVGEVPEPTVSMIAKGVVHIQ